jgi:hypothetical protein
VHGWFLLHCKKALAARDGHSYLVHRSNTVIPGCLPFLDVSSLNLAVPQGTAISFSATRARRSAGTD